MVIVSLSEIIDIARAVVFRDNKDSKKEAQNFLLNSFQRLYC